MSSIQLPTLPSMSAVDTVPLRPAAGCSERTNRMYSIKKKKVLGFEICCVWTHEQRHKVRCWMLRVWGRRGAGGWAAVETRAEVERSRCGCFFFWKGEGDTGGRRWSWLLSRASMFLKNTHVLKYHVDYFGAINAKDRVENDWSGLSRTSTF